MYSLVINCGSSSLKFSLINVETNAVLLSGVAEALATDKANFSLSYQGKKYNEPLTAKDHADALAVMFHYLTTFNLAEKISAIGHRVVHGAEHFSNSVLITDDVIQAIKKCIPIAPLHNPANLIGIEEAMKITPHLPHIAVFDTAFHQTMPETAYLYGLPLEFYKNHSIRRYGFHGTSHQYVTEASARFLGKKKDSLNLITAHLGNGVSITAVKEGISIDTSMGFTPLEGVIMGTRSGSIDPALLTYLHHELGYTVDEIDTLLNKKSGLLGISGLSNDCRELEKAHQQGERKATLALELFVYRIAKTIASYLVPLGRLDALVFTAGIGENSIFIREKIIHQLNFMQYKLDKKANQTYVQGKSGVIARSGNFGVVLVIPTDEEGLIAQEANRLMPSL